jgi:hypothetical protein
VAISQVTVTGTFVDFSGQAMTGRIIFTPTPTAVNDAGADLVYMSRPVSVLLTTGGRLSVDLAATDDTDGNPVGFTYTVTEEFDNFAGGRTYPISLPAANSPVDLADISPESSASAGTVVWAGMPVGGTVGQFMVKTGVDNYDAGWSTMADQYLQGTGSPNGVVTAVVGSMYTDTAATNGAIRWIKATGSGNTGWRVEYGDTGWREIGSVLLNGFTATSVKIRRFGDQVSITIFALDGSSSTGTTLYTLPTGFASDSRIRQTWMGQLSSDQTPNAAITYFSNTISLGTSRTLITSGRGTIDYLTTDTWPATLPGTAV